MSEEASQSCKFVFKKRVSRNQRKREISDDEKNSSDDDNESAVVRRETKKPASNPMRQTTGSSNIGKNSQDSDTDEDGSSRISLSYKSKRLQESEQPRDMGATSVVETETETTKDAQAIFERALEVNKNLKGKADDKIYRGLNNYAVQYEKKDTAQGNASSGMVRKGPIRAPANIRSTVRWDYQPDLCKDYKETGFCGFGDSCKFMHDRTDYKYGWQLERDVKEKTYGQDDPSQYEIHSSDEDTNIPFKCYICRESFTDPVITKCKHYFCEKCALAHYRKTQRCYSCGEQTMGVFLPAKDVIAKLKSKSEAKKKENNSGSSDSE